MSAIVQNIQAWTSGSVDEYHHDKNYPPSGGYVYAGDDPVNDPSHNFNVWDMACFKFAINSTLGSEAHVFDARLKYWVNTTQAGTVTFGYSDNTAQWNDNTNISYRRLWEDPTTVEIFINKGVSGTAGPQVLDTGQATPVQHMLDVNRDEWWWILDNNGTGWYAFYSHNNASGYAPKLVVTYGYKLQSSQLTVTGGVRSVTASWSALSGAHAYDIYLDGTFQYQTVPGNTSVTFSNLSASSHSIGVDPYYATYGNTGRVTKSATPNTGTAPAPTAYGDTPYREAIRINKPASYYSNDSWDYVITDLAWNWMNSVNGTTTYVQASTSATQDIGTGAYYLAPGSYYAWVRARWNNGDVSNWAASPTITTTQPVVSNLVASTNQYRQITATWDRLNDAASYQLTWTPIGGSSSNTSVTQPASGGLSYTITNLKSGSYYVQVYPVYTNGYVGPVTTVQVTAQVLLPTPAAPTAAANTPQYRQITGTAPQTNSSSLPSAYYSAQSWDFSLDGNTASAVNTTTATAVLSQVPAGTHSVQVRARWSDGDVGPWSASSTSVTTTTPSVASPAARQRSADQVGPVLTVATTGGTIPANTYYVSTSINKGGNRSTSTVNSATRATNESSIAPATSTTTTGPASTIQVPRPTNAQSGDTWNVYIGTLRNNFKTVVNNVAYATTTYTITSYVAPTTNEAKIGMTDIQWSTPVGVADAPTSYQIQRAPANPSNSPTGTAGTYQDVTARVYSGFYSTTNFFEDKVGSGYWFYRIAAVWANESSAPVEIVV